MLNAALSRSGNFRVVAFVDPDHTGLNRRQAFQRQLRFFVRSLNSKDAESTFRAMGAKRMIYPHFSRTQREMASHTAKVFFDSSPSKNDVETLRIDGVLVGDLIYDDYLLKSGQGTVDPGSSEFREHMTESLKIFYFWKRFFERFRVTAVIGNSVYRQALVARIGIAHGCDVFDAQLPRVVRLVGDGYQFEDTKYYSEHFSSLTNRAGRLQEAHRALEKKKQGSADMSNAHFESPSGTRKSSRYLKPGSTPKILVTPHCFSDSAHAFGQMVFPDFQEWLSFLASVAKDSTDDWYIKLHPRGQQDQPVIAKIFSECENVSILPPDASLDQLAEEGVSVALTMRGHVGFDFPLKGIPVISCTPGYRYRNYAFNIQVSNTEQYRAALEGFIDEGQHIDADEMAEFYYMDTLYYHPNLFFPDLVRTTRQAAHDAAGGILGQFAATVEESFIEETLSQLEAFVRTRDLRFRRQQKIDT